MTPDPIPQARESAVEMRPLPSRDELARMLDARAFADAQHPHDESMIIQTDRVRAAYETADQLLAYFGLDKTALATPSGDDVAELRAERDALQKRVRVLEESIQSYLDGNYDSPRSHRPKPCRHGQEYYQPCEACIDEHFQRALGVAALATPSGDDVAELRAERDALQAENARLREALEPFGAEVECYDPPEGDDHHVAWCGDFLIGQLRRARAALTLHQQGNGGEGHGG